MKRTKNLLQNQKLLSLLTFILLVPALVFSQQNGDWEWQNPLPQGYDLNDVEALDGQTAIAVGNNGTILKSDDGGKSWHMQQDSIDADIDGVYFLNDSEGWAVGGDRSPDRSLILHTQDGGKNWSVQLNDNNSRLYDLHFATADSGWAVGSDGRIMHTKDGGNTWSSQSSGGNFYLLSVVFTDANNGWAVGEDGTLLHTNDGGNNWQTQASTVSTDLESAFFISSDTGWVSGGNNTVIYTTDGGNNWKDRSLSSGGGDLQTVFFKSAKIGMVVGGSSGNNIVYITSNGGKSWSLIRYRQSQMLYGLDFEGDDTAWAVGSKGKVIKSTDGGASWSLQSEGTINDIESCHFINSQYGWAVGDGSGINNSQAILHTKNGGKNWKDQYVNDGLLHSVFFIDSSHGWTVGDKGTLLKTRDGGQSWLSQSLQTNERLLSTHFIDTNTGWLVGDDGTILHTNDGGNNWKSQSLGRDIRFNKVFFVDSQNGWVVGGKADTVFYTNNGGKTWKGRSTGFDEFLSSIHFVDQQNGWIVGNGGLILHTNNGGRDWKKQSSGVSHDLSSVYFTSANKGWAISDEFYGENVILHTQDGGKTWETNKEVYDRQLSQVNFANDYSGWVVGSDGTILHYSNCKASDTIDRSACSRYTSPSGDYVWTQNGTYTDTLNEIPWCDTLSKMYITVNLSLKGNSTSNISATACNSYLSPSGRYKWTQSDVYKDTISSNAGCDSIITIDLTINNSPKRTTNPSTCDQYTSPSGNYTWTQSGTYQDTVSNPDGCDSIITIDLTITEVDTQVTKTGSTLEASASDATYQWLDCDNNYAPVSDATGQSFTPSTSGNYAVEVSNNNCTDTSSCFQVQTTGMLSKSSNGGFEVYPNPAADQLTIVQQGNLQPQTFQLQTLTGKAIKTGQLSGTERLDVSNLSPGVYLLEVQGEDAVRTKKVIVK